MNWQINYQAPDMKLWVGRDDGLGIERCHQAIQLLNLQNKNVLPQIPGIGILGFCCDLGVKRNQGRIGAEEGPSSFRQACANLPLPNNHSIIYDCGNIICVNDNLEDAQKALAQAVECIISHKLIPVVIGGGHETAWGHYQGLRQAYSNQKITIINFDAHFDLRPLPKDGIGTSGTPFIQIAHDCQNRGLPFDYTVIGIQPSANTDSLFTTARDLNVNWISADEVHQNSANIFSQIEKTVKQSTAIYLTLCLDVFSTSIAPGVSAPQINGIFPWEIRKLLHYLIQSKKIIGMDIVELAPCYDEKNSTAKLASLLFYEFSQVFFNFSG